MIPRIDVISSTPRLEAICPVIPSVVGPLKRDGIETAVTFAGPRTWTRSAVTVAESIPPLSPTIALRRSGGSAERNSRRRRRGTNSSAKSRGRRHRRGLARAQVMDLSGVRDLSQLVERLRAGASEDVGIKAPCSTPNCPWNGDWAAKA